MNGDILSIFENINVRIVDGKPSLYNPVLILYALEQCYLHNERLLIFQEIERRLNTIFSHCFPAEKYKNFHIAFGRLENDGIWEVIGKNSLRHSSSGDLLKSDLIKNKVTGGFTEAIYNALKADKFLIKAIGDQILNQYIDESIHCEFLQQIKYK